MLHRGVARLVRPRPCVSYALSFSTSSSSSPPPPAPALTDNVYPVSTAGSWYDPNSIERRLRRKRNEPRIDPVTGQPSGRSGLCIGAPTEEEAYLAAGAPGYGSQAVVSVPTLRVQSATSTSTSNINIDNSTSHEHAAITNTSTPVTVTSTAVTSTRVSHEEMIGTLIRVSTGVVPRTALPAFVRVWQLLALPAYASARGCMSARLVVGEDRGGGVGVGGGGGGGDGVSSNSANASNGDDARASTRFAAAGPRGGAATVVAITEWADETALEEAARSPAYSKAMQQLGVHFRGSPTMSTLGQEAANVGNFAREKGKEVRDESDTRIRSWAL
jgi:hypothetical protein